MLPKPTHCAACGLVSKGTGFAWGSGTGSNGVMLFGEALGAREVQLGTPFVGDAGVQLNRTLQRVDSPREAFRIDNAVRCRPPNNWLDGAPWEDDAVNNCRHYFYQELNRHKPKVIVPMGNVPLRALLGKEGIERFRGYVYEYDICTPEADHLGLHVVPTYHPSFIMRGAQNLTDVQAIDIRRALRTARSGYREPEHHYIEHPTGYDLEQFYKDARVAAGNGLPLSADIETPRSGGADEDEYGTITDTEILRVSFSFKEHHAITITWVGPFIPWIERILALPWSFVLFWNKEFDQPRLLSKGMKFGGKVLDAMYCWHFLQSDLPKKLGYVATFFTELREWKSLSDEQPEFYSCVDADAQLQCFNKIHKLLEDQGRFDWFLRHYVDLQPSVDEMAFTGVPLDTRQRDKFRGEIDKELCRIDEEIQGVVPMELKKVKYRKSWPPDVKLGEQVRASDEHWFWDYDKTTGEIIERKKFLYGSPKDVLAYMEMFGHPIPINYKTGNPTTGAAEIEKLARKFPDDELYPRILGARGFRKIMGQYVDGYRPGPDGRIRTHFNRKPSTWRFDSYDPNVQNVLKRKELAKEYRKQFIAAPGFALVELDYKAIEAQLVGFFADDPDYIRAAKLGIHAILMSHVLERPINLKLKDRDIQELVKALKRSDEMMYDACKHVVHGSNYLGSARKMRIEYPDMFKNVAAAKKMQDIYFGTIARKVKTWQQKTLHEGYMQHWLENPFGYRHYFWDVLHYRGKQLEWGTDAKRAVAFKPQSTAAGVLCEALIRLRDKYPEVFRMLRWTIHDSLLAEIRRDGNMYTNIKIIKDCMEAPNPQLGGLSIEVEVLVGQNWGEMEEYEVDRRWFA